MPEPLGIPTVANIAFLGTGLLGSAFADAAAKRGDTVTAWNRSPDKAHACARFGIALASTPAEAVCGARRVHIILKDDAVVNDVIATAHGGLSADAILIDRFSPSTRWRANSKEMPWYCLNFRCRHSPRVKA